MAEPLSRRTLRYPAQDADSFPAYATTGGTFAWPSGGPPYPWVQARAGRFCMAGSAETRDLDRELAGSSRLARTIGSRTSEAWQTDTSRWNIRPVGLGNPARTAGRCPFVNVG